MLNAYDFAAIAAICFTVFILGTFWFVVKIDKHVGGRSRNKRPKKELDPFDDDGDGI